MLLIDVEPIVTEHRAMAHTILLVYWCQVLLYLDYDLIKLCTITHGHGNTLPTTAIAVLYFGGGGIMISLHDLCQSSGIQIANVGMCAKCGDFYHVYLSENVSTIQSCNSIVHVILRLGNRMLFEIITKKIFTQARPVVIYIALF